MIKITKILARLGRYFLHAIFLTFKVPPEICIILQKVFVTIYVMANITEKKCNFDFHKKIPLAIDNNFTTFILKSYCRRFYA